MKTCGVRKNLKIGTQPREMHTLTECAFLCPRGYSFAGTWLGFAFLQKGRGYEKA